MGMHLYIYIYDYQIKSTAFFNISSELHSSSSIHTSYLQGFIGTELVPSEKRKGMASMLGYDKD